MNLRLVFFERKRAYEVRIRDWSSDVGFFRSRPQADPGDRPHRASGRWRCPGDLWRHRGAVHRRRRGCAAAGCRFLPAHRELPGEDLRRGEDPGRLLRSEEHTSELQSLMRISYAVFCLKKKTRSNELTIETTKLSDTRWQHIRQEYIL